MPKCAEIVEPKRPLVIRECEVPATPEKGLVVRVNFASINRGLVYQKNDFLDFGHLGKMSYSDWYTLPIIPGLGCSGTVHSIGEGVTAQENEETLSVGDRVAVFPFLGCRNCDACQDGRHKFCQYGADAPINTLGSGLPGGLANFISLPTMRNVIRLRQDLEMDMAAGMADTIAPAYSCITSAFSTIETVIKESGKAAVLIIGMGAIGLCTVNLARQKYPKETKIVCATRSISKVEVAKLLGASEVVIWQGDEKEVVQKTMYHGFNGFHGIIDTVGTSSSFSRAYEVVQKGGIIVEVGSFGGSFMFAINDLIKKAVTLTGIFAASRPLMKETMDYIAELRIEGPPMCIYGGLESVNQAIDDLEQGNIIGKAVLKVASL